MRIEFGETSGMKILSSIVHYAGSTLFDVSKALFGANRAAGILTCGRTVRAVPAIALSILFFAFPGVSGVLAQDVTGPVGVFEQPECHDGMTPFSMAIVFDEEPKNIKRHPLVGTLIRGSTDPSTGRQTNNAYSNEEHGPLITLREKDPNDKRRYTFTVTPRAPVGLRIRLSGGYKDSSGNRGTTISSTAIRSSVPVSNAGPDQTVGSGTTVVLNGNGSACAPGTIGSAGYAWTRTGGTEGVTATLHNANTKTATFTADTLAPGAPDVTHVFTLTVTDNDDDTDTDTVTITVTADNMAPVANAGIDQTVNSGATVTLQGVNSLDNDGTIASHDWKRTGGTEGVRVILSSVSAEQPTFRAHTLIPGSPDVTHEFTLTVTDDDGATDTDTVVITVASPFAAPVAEAGRDRPVVASGATVTLDGSDSIHDRRRTITSYAWTRTGGTGDDSVVLTGPNTRRPTLVVETLEAGADNVTHEFTLTVTDSAGDTDTDTVMITVISGFALPVANAGPDREFGSGTTVTLDGGGSTVDRRRPVKSHAWSRTGGTTGGSVTLTGETTARPTFTAETLAADADNVTHIFTLTVTDAANVTDTDTVTITVTSGNAIPVANAGDDRTVVSGTEVVLDGRGSTDSDGTIASWAWTRTAGTGNDSVVLTTTSRTMARPTFTADTVQAGTADVTQVFSLVVTDDDGGMSVADTVTITITPANDIPVAKAGDDQRVGSGATVVLDGGGSYSIGGKIRSHAWEQTGGTGGSVTLGNANSARTTFTTNTLAEGAADVTHVFTLTVTDDDGDIHTDTVTITVTAGDTVPPNGMFEAPNIHDGETSFEVALLFDEEVEINGNSVAAFLVDIPVRRILDPAAGWKLGFEYNDDEHGPYVSNFSKDPNNNLRYTFRVTPSPRTAADAVPVDIRLHLRAGRYEDLNGNRGAFDINALVRYSRPHKPVANAGPDQEVASGATVTLDGSGSTANEGLMIASWAWTRTGGTVGASAPLSSTSVAKPTFTAETLEAGAADVTHVFSLVVRDDGNKVSIADTVTITVESPFVTPVAHAGMDRTVHSGPGEIIALDGSGSTFDHRRPISRAWVRTGGTTGAQVSLSDATAEQPTFTAEALVPDAEGVIHDVMHVFTLTVTDSAGETATDTVTITVTAPNMPPSAFAGVDQTVGSGMKVTLNGSNSTDSDATDRTRQITSWVWSRPLFMAGATVGRTVILTDANMAKAGFTADTLTPGAEDVVHILTLTVTDDDGATDTDAVAVTVTAPFAIPVARAGSDQVVHPGASVTLDGSGSTVDRRRTVESYAWERVGGTAGASVTLSSASAEQPGFTADTTSPSPDVQIVKHVFRLTVTDSAGETSADTVSVSIVIPNTDAGAGPNTDTDAGANAGPDRTVTSGTTVTLDGSASTVDRARTIRSYAWRWLKVQSTPNIEEVTLTGEMTAMPTFTAPVVVFGKDVVHAFALTVTDSAGFTDVDRVSITVISPFADPVANAGPDRKVGSGTVVTLDGSGSTVDLRRSDPSGSYTWARTGGTGGAVTLSDANVEQPTFTADSLATGASDVTHVFTLTVTDSADEESTDMVTITVTLGNVDPVANAGDDRTVVSGTTVQLDGSSSLDSDGTIMSRTWVRTGGTGGTVTLSNANMEQPTFTADIVQPGGADVTHVFMLTVTDDDGATATDTVTITVAPANVVPVANAGVDQTVGSGTRVTLDGSRSYDIGGTIESYAWQRTGGTAGTSVVLGLLSVEKRIFTADTLAEGAADVTHVFTLTVTDNDGVINTDTVTITVTASGDTTPPSGMFEAPQTHDGSTAFSVNLVFNEVVEEIDVGDLVAIVNNTSLFPKDPSRDGEYDALLLPMISDLENDLSDPRRWSFNVKPNNRDDLITFVLRARDYRDLAGNSGVANIISIPVLYLDATVTNAMPDADAGDDRTVQSGAPVVLDGSDSDDSDGDIMFYAWSRTGGTAGGSVILTGADTAIAGFTADTLAPGADDVSHEFTLTVTDASRHSFGKQVYNAETDMIETVTGRVPDACRNGSLSEEYCSEIYRNSVTDTVTVTVNAPPDANAGDDMTVESEMEITLDGTGSSDSGRISTYAWTRTGGTGVAVPLIGANTATAYFRADTLVFGAEDMTHTFMLAVTDDDGRTTTDTVTVTVVPGFENPVAVASTTTPLIGSGEMVTLDGSNSTVDSRRTIKSWNWERTGGTGDDTLSLVNADTAMPTFTTETRQDGAMNVTHDFTLTVTDSADVQSTATVRVTVVSDFANPRASAAVDRNMVISGTPVTLDGSESEFDFRRGPPEFSWQRTGGTTGETVTLANADMAMATFTDTIALNAQPVNHVFTLTVTDSAGTMSTDMVTVTIIPDNEIPVAIVEPVTRMFKPGETVMLDGRRSMDDNGSVAAWTWTRERGTGNEHVVLTGATTSQLSFTADALNPGDMNVTHVFSLVVTDNNGAESLPVEVTVTVVSDFAAPVANAGPDQENIMSGTPVMLDGSESDFDFRRGPLSYTWVRTGGTEGRTVTLDHPATEQPTFTETLNNGDRDVSHVFTLTVTDSTGAMNTDTVEVTIVSGFAEPVADAGENRRIISESDIQLDGSGSTGDFRKPLSYAWVRTGGTGRDSVTLANENTARPSFTAERLNPGSGDVTHVFRLTVSDEDGRSATDTVTVTVFAAAVDILVSPSEITIQEGGTGVYRVKLGESPGQEVVVMAVSDHGEVVLDNPYLLFDENNWYELQEIRVGTIADADRVDDTAVIRHIFTTPGISAAGAGEVKITVRETDPLLRRIGDYLDTRATVLLGQQPGLIGLVKQDKDTSNGNFTLKATSGRLNIDGGFVRKGTWGEATAAYVDSRSGNTKSVLASFGIHKRYSENLLAGVMLQLDHVAHDLSGQAGSVDGMGWLVGPYFAGRHNIQPLYFEGRLLYGQSGNDIRFDDPDLDLRTGSFDTERLLAQLRLEGEIGLSNDDDGSRLIPYVDARWMKDRAEAFTDNLGNRVPGQILDIGEMELGSGVEIPVAMSRGEMTLVGGLGWVMSNRTGDHAGTGWQGRGRIDAGFLYDLDDNIRIDLEGFHDGLGISGYESYGVSLNMEIRF